MVGFGCFAALGHPYLRFFTQLTQVTRRSRSDSSDLLFTHHGEFDGLVDAPFQKGIGIRRQHSQLVE